VAPGLTQEQEKLRRDRGELGQDHKGEFLSSNGVVIGRPPPRANVDSAAIHSLGCHWADRGGGSPRPRPKLKRETSKSHRCPKQGLETLFMGGGCTKTSPNRVACGFWTKDYGKDVKSPKTNPGPKNGKIEGFTSNRPVVDERTVFKRGGREGVKERRVSTDDKPANKTGGKSPGGATVLPSAKGTTPIEKNKCGRWLPGVLQEQRGASFHRRRSCHRSRNRSQSVPTGGKKKEVGGP